MKRVRSQRFFFLLAALCVLYSCAKAKGDAGTSAFSSSQVTPGKIAQDLSAYRIAYYEPGAAAGAGGQGGADIAESDDPFTVVDYGPRDMLPEEIKKSAIYMVFSQPVIPLAQLGDPIREDLDGKSPGLFVIEPPLRGVYRWYGTRLLSFEPDAEILPQHRYTVTASEKFRSLGGKKLEGEKSFSFETEGLRLLSWQLGDGSAWVNTRNVDPLEAKNIRLVFSYPVNLGEIARWIEVRAGGRTWPFSLARLPDGAEQGVLLTLNETLPLDSAVELRILAGARSEPGWLGSKEDAVFNFHTLLPFSFERVSVRSAARPRTEEGDSIPISLQFSQSVDPDNSPALFSIRGMPELTKEHVRFYGSTVVLNHLPLEYEKTYEVRVSENLRDLWGRPLGKAVTAQAVVEMANSYAYFSNYGSKMLEAGFPPMVVWETQNPLSIRSNITGTAGPYEQLPLSSLSLKDLSLLPKNSKRFFMEDLSPYLGPGGKGSVGMRWEYETFSDWERGRVYKNGHWLTVQVTDIGITVRYAYNKVLVWATELSTGRPLANAVVELLEGANPRREARTNAQGLAVFEFADGEFGSLFTTPIYNSSLSQGPSSTPVGRGLRVRVSTGGGAMAGGDQAEFLPNSSHNIWRFDVEASVSAFAAEQDRPVIFLFTDRGLYRPGETVTFRVIDRTLSRGKYQVYEGDYSIEAAAAFYDGPQITRFTGRTTQNGGGYGSFTLPTNLDPGQYLIRYQRGAATQMITFTVANFERLRFEASLSFPDLVFYQGERISANLAASYLAGGSLASAPYSYFWSREAAGFNPGDSGGRHWSTWRFGPENADNRYYVSRGEGSLGPDGTASISQIVGADGTEGAAYRYRLEASVQDAARQEISAKAAALVHPASFCIGSRLDAGTLKSPGENDAMPSAWFLPEKSPATLSWVLLSPEGEPWIGSGEGPELSFQLIHYEWKQSRQAGINGRINLNWERVEEVAEEQSFRPGRGNWSGVIPLSPGGSGQWEVRLRTVDEQGRPVLTRYGFYVSGSGWVRWGRSDSDQITLSPDKAGTPDRPSYVPGDTAKILVQSPLPKGSYLLTLEREGIISEEIIELDGSARTIDIPIDESYVPIVYVAIASYTVRSAPPENSYYEPDLDKPKGLFGLTSLFVDNESRHYQIEIQPSKGAYGPAEEAEVTLKVTLNGQPAAGTELSFMAVDRGVVDLIDYHVPDPLAYFYNPRNFPLGVQGADSRSLLIDPVTYSLTDLQGGDDEDTSKLEERKDFRPTAIFEPYLVTGPDGTVSVKFALPDSLTTYRCTAVAVGLSDFGIAEKDLRVSAPLTATAALPRKLRWRDTGTVSLILSNLSNEVTQARVSVETQALISENAAWDTVIEIDGESEQTLEIPPGATQEIAFKVAALGAGESRIIFTLRSPAVNERIVKTLTVERPVVYESVTTIGSLGSERPFIEEGVVLPGLIPEGTGELSVSLSASRLANLKEAVRYLLDYPYGCLEQLSARLLPLIAFGDHLEAFQLESPVENPGQIIRDELSQLGKYQLADGSFPYWPGGQSGDLYVSLRMAHIIALAAEKAYRVPPEINSTALLRYIAGADSRTARILQNDHFLKGYSLWVRAMHGERIGSELSDYLKRKDEPGIAGWGFAGLAAHELGLKDIAQSARDRMRRFIRPGTSSLDLTDTYERGQNFWGYDTDRYAIALMLYQALSPEDDMTTRLANSLIGRQRRGIWNNTASSFWGVLAFGRIADEEKETGTNFVSRLSLGNNELAAGRFQSYGGVPQSETWHLDETPLDSLDRDTILPLRIEQLAPGENQKTSGRLYYSASLRYGVPSELASPRDEGLSVFAETLDSRGNVVKDGFLVPGKTYTRRVTVSSSRARTYVALRAPVPSGVEIVDAVFVTSSTVPPPEPDEDEERPAYERNRPTQFIMDDEVRFHWDFFPAGMKEVEFRFRAVMPGVYPTPPVQAECMYEEEIFGRGAGELWRIESEG
jgi:uncharacterized protein YfaS (alpha-2-macroglobulin family)